MPLRQVRLLADVKKLNLINGIHREGVSAQAAPRKGVRPRRRKCLASFDEALHWDPSPRTRPEKELPPSLAAPELSLSPSLGRLTPCSHALGDDLHPWALTFGLASPANASCGRLDALVILARRRNYRMSPLITVISLSPSCAIV